MVDRISTSVEAVRNSELPLAGKKAFVTGGAGGVGKGISDALARRRIEELVIGCTPWNEARAEEAAKEIRTRGVIVHVLAEDISKEDSPLKINEKLKGFGIEHLDIVVHNAGVSLEKAIGRGVTDEQRLLIRKTNYDAVVNITKGLAQAGLIDGETSIVGIASTFGKYPDPEGKINPEYSKWKAALIALFTSSDVHEQLGIDPKSSVNVVIPGMVTAKIRNMSSELNDEILGILARKTPGGKLVTEDQVGDVVGEVVNPNFRFSGLQIIIDNGLGENTFKAIGESIEEYRIGQEAKAKERKRLRSVADQVIAVFKQNTQSANNSDGDIKKTLLASVPDEDKVITVYETPNEANPRATSYTIYDTSSSLLMTFSRDEIITGLKKDTDPDSLNQPIENPIDLLIKLSEALQKPDVDFLSGNLLHSNQTLSLN